MVLQKNHPFGDVAIVVVSKRFERWVLRGVY